MANRRLKHFLFFPLMGVLAGLLLGCAAIPLNFHPYVSSLAPFEQTAVTTDSYFRPEAYGENYTSMVSYHPTPSKRRVPLSSLGDQKVLVIPVEFSDYRASDLPLGADRSRTVLQNAFFGKPETTQWESLASFYDKSSYGQLRITGFVSDWYLSGFTVANMATSGAKTVTTESILNGALVWYQSVYGDLSSFDQNEDGYVDAVFLVYAPPYIDNDSVLWAFSSFDTGRDGASYIGNPTGNAYAWASYHFLNVYNQKGDPHTFIHEFGHVLGLTDYYNTSSLPSVFPEYSPLDPVFQRYQYTHGPTGRADMMDYSIGDHTSLSKMLLGWTRPFVVTGSGSIHIDPFATSGDVIIFANDWNGKAFDEYIALELYAPIGLNYVDSERGYGHQSARLMGRYGIKAYHIDARASYHRTALDAFISYEEEGAEQDLPSDIYASGQYYRQVAHTNTYGTTQNGNLIYQLLEKGGSTTFLTGAMATNETLFYAGDTFGVNDFLDFTFNDGTTLPFTFQVSSVDRFGATITFTAI